MEQRLWRKHSRSALHSQWAHGLETELHDIAALWGELMVTTLEALLVVHDDLEDRGWAPNIYKDFKGTIKTWMLGKRPNGKWTTIKVQHQRLHIKNYTSELQQNLPDNSIAWALAIIMQSIQTCVRFFGKGNLVLQILMVTALRQAYLPMARELGAMVSHLVC